MFDKILVYEALKHSLAHDASQNTPANLVPDRIV